MGLPTTLCLTPPVLGPEPNQGGHSGPGSSGRGFYSQFQPAGVSGRPFWVMKSLSPGQYPRGQEDLAHLLKGFGSCVHENSLLHIQFRGHPTLQVWWHMLWHNVPSTAAHRLLPLRKFTCSFRSLSSVMVRAKEMSEAWSSPSPVLPTSVVQVEIKVPDCTLWVSDTVLCEHLYFGDV